jgi:hypothetical protein
MLMTANPTSASCEAGNRGWEDHPPASAAAREFSLFQAEPVAEAIAGAAIILTGHWATMDDMIADLIAGGLMQAFGVVVLLMWSFQR